jgi:thiamine-phosphate pyrophosphorylase
VTLPRLYLITDRARAADGGRDVVQAVEAALQGGADFIQCRDKSMPDRERWSLARRVARLCRRYDAQWVVNGRADLAMDFGARGVHRPADGIPLEAVRRLMGADSWVGASAHDLDEALLAERAGADFVTLSPIFTTPSKPGYGPPLGLEALQEVAQLVDIPVYALAGITPGRVGPCLEAGAHGVAVMGGIMAASDPAARTRAYLEALENAVTPR